MKINISIMDSQKSRDTGKEILEELRSILWNNGYTVDEFKEGVQPIKTLAIRELVGAITINDVLED